MKYLALIALLAAACSSPSEPKGSNNAVVIITENSENGMTCPQCAGGEVCVGGFCQLEGCEPTCEGTACGPNGCGGMCNPCEGREACIDGTCELAPMDCSGFAQDPTSWAIPQNLFEDEQFEMAANRSGACGGGSGEFTHQVMDLTGDGKPDLVLTDRCDAGGVGTIRWDVHENTGSGFADSPTAWAIPQNLFEDEQFETIANRTGACGSGSGEFTHQVMDLTGDGRPDMVLTDRCDAGGVGTIRWDVYENTGSGFAETPKAWAVPQNLFEDEQFEMVANRSGACGSGSGEFTYVTMDLTGDAKPDLVLTDRCDAGGVGTVRWDVYENTGSGFSDSPTTWAIPQNLFEDEQFEMIGNRTGACGSGSGEFTHQVMDLTGDGKPDLVLTDRCDAGGVGTIRWDVYENTGSGFADSPTSWAIPQNLFEDEQFEMAANRSGACGGGSGEFTHQVMDMDGDAMPDLLLSDRCDAGGVGTIRWEYYRNQGDGFAADATTWEIPQDLFEDEQFEMIANRSGACGGGSGEFTHHVMDLDGDGALDLVLTDRCDAGGVGTIRWDVHAASCGG